MLRRGRGTRWVIVLAVVLGLGPQAAPAYPRVHQRVLHARHLRHAAARRHRRRPVRALPPATVAVPLTFTVDATNRSLIPCPAPGGRVRIAGTLVAPAAALSRPGALTLYLHGLGFAQFFWHFTAIPGYDYATAMARAGHASVIVDRVGYGASDRPAGTAICLGEDADIAHQLISALRAARYTIAGRAPVAFRRVALVGHSAGGAVAEIEAASFGDADALGVVSYADQGQSPLTVQLFGLAGFTCAAGGVPSGGAPGYAPFGTTSADFNAAMFHDAVPAVVAATDAMRTLDPCGIDESFPQALALDPVIVRHVAAAVLVMIGASDALFPPPGGLLEKSQFTGSHDVTLTELPDTGHAVTLGRTAPAFTVALSGWLAAHGF